MTVRLIKRYLRILLSHYFGFPLYQPDSVSLIITDRCNLKCKMCEYWNQDSKGKGPLGLKEWEELLDDLEREDVRQIQFTGGEPLISPDLFSIFRAAKSNGFETTLLTNGTLIDEKNCGSILDLVDSIYISLDSPRPQVHDCIRGAAGTFEKTTRAIQLLSEVRKKKGKKAKITVCAIITMMGLHSPKEMLDLVKELGADRLIYNPACRGSYGYSNLKNDFAAETMKMAEYDEMIDGIIELMDENEAIIKSNPFYLESSKRFLRGDKRYFYFPCYGGGYNGPVVNYDGEVFPCCAWNFSLGNVRQKPFSKIWKSVQAQKLRKRIKNKNCPMCHHHTRTFDYLLRAPLLVKNPIKLWKGYRGLFKL